MARKNFKFRMDDSEKDLTQLVEVDELQEYALVVDPLDEMQVQIFVNEKRIPIHRLWKKEEPSYCFISKRKYKFRNIGIYNLKLVIDGDVITQKIRVRPVKITQKDYETMLEDIKEEVYNLIFSTFGRSVEYIKMAFKTQPKIPIEFFSFFERNFRRFRAIFRRIRKDPNRGLRKQTKLTEIYETDYFDDIVEFQKADKIMLPIQKKFRGIIPKKVLVFENVQTHDVYENRLLKHFLGLIINKLNFIEKVAEKEERLAEENQDIFRTLDKRIEKWKEIALRCREYRRIALNMWNEDFIEDVARIKLLKTSMVLQKEPRYKIFYELYQDFRKNSVVEVHSDYFYMPIRQAWDIYEIWVFLELCKVLKKMGFELEEQHLIEASERFSYDVKNTRFDFRLRKNEPLLQLRRKDLVAKLYYQRDYPVDFKEYGSKYGKKTPDIVVEIFKDGKPVPEIVIFDPKYRIAEEKPPDTPLKDMSHYVETIRDREDKRIVKKAYIIYPGDFIAHLTPTIGFIGLVPTQDREEFVDTVRKLVSSITGFT